MRRRPETVVVSLLVVTAILVGCAAQPELRQQAIETPSAASKEAYDTYGLQATLLKIDPGNETPTVASQIVDARTKSGSGVLFQLFLDDPFYQTTKLSITKRDGTSVVQTAGVEVLDARKEFIATAGKLLSSAISLTGATPMGDDEPSIGKNAILPTWFRAEDYLSAGDRGKIDVVVADGILANYGGVPYNSIPLKEVIALGKHRFDGLYFSACRDLLLTVFTAVTKEDGTNAVDKRRESKFFYKVADPNFVTRQPFPLSGSLSSHESCGVSTTNTVSAEQASPLPGLVEAALDATKAVNDATEAAQRARKARREAEESARKAREAERKAKEAEQSASEPAPPSSP